MKKLYNSIFSPKTSKEYYEIGSKLSGQEAIKAYKKAILLDPENAPAYNNLGRLFWEEGLHGLAIENLERAALLSPQDSVYKSNLTYMKDNRTSFLEEEYSEKTPLLKIN